jgi:hypothetical protein
MSDPYDQSRRDFLNLSAAAGASPLIDAGLSESATIDRSARVTSPLAPRVALQSVWDANLLGGPSRQPSGLTPYSLR